MKIRVYISGPMTGITCFNFPAFKALAVRVAAAGFEPVNPAENFGGNTQLPRHVYFREDIRLLLTVGAITFLPGWKKSKGARLEAMIAREIGIPTLRFGRGNLLSLTKTPKL